jgi:hypothetical protein
MKFIMAGRGAEGSEEGAQGPRGGIMKRIVVHVGDITRLDVTAIANAANR